MNGLLETIGIKNERIAVIFSFELRKLFYIKYIFQRDI